MYDYSIFYRRPIRVARITHEVPTSDLFISAYNSSDRVRQVFEQVVAAKKVWLVHPEYQYAPIEQPSGPFVVRPVSRDEVVQVDALIGEVGDLSGRRLCIDITGFMRHVLVFLVEKLAHVGVTTFTALYSEPNCYVKQEQTVFSTVSAGNPRPVRGMAGSNFALGKDYLIVGVGYDHKLVSEVANHKDSSTVYPIFAFPSLSPDMYQESAIRASQSGDIALGTEWVAKRRFAPANDPFSTASVVSEVVREIDRFGEPANIYLSPLSTKVQALGFAVYWHLEGRHRGAVTMLLPECVTYARETSKGLNRLWSFTVELNP